MTNPSLAAHTAVDGAVDTLRGPLTTFLQSLVATPSVTGHERDAQRLIEAKYRALGLDVTLLESTHSLVASHPAFSDDGLPLVDRVNVIGAWRGSGAPEARSLILNGHVDVVPEGDRARWTVEPFGGIEREGFIYGRGACDMKGGLVASAFAIEALKAIGFQPGADVTLESVVGEETGGVGTLTTIIHGIRADGCIITEPTHLGIWTAQSGALTFRITVRGLLAHAAFKSHGVSAIELFAPILAMLQRLDVERHQRHSHPLFQDPTNIAPISVGVVRAGDWPSTVPALLVAEGRFGVFPGETIAEARATLEQALHREAERHPWLRDHPPTLEWFEGQFESGEIAPDAPIVRTVAAEHARVHGAEARLGGVPAGTDARLFLRHADIPTVLYGAGELTAAHTFDERVGIEEVIQCTKVLAHTIIAWCGTGAGASGGVSAGDATLGDTIRAVRDSGVTR